MKLNHLLLTLFGALLSLTVTAQERTAPSPWTLLTEDQSTIFEYHDIDFVSGPLGVNHKVRVIRLTNKSSQPVTVSWYQEAYYNSNCSTCGNKAEYTYEATIPAGKSIEGDLESISQQLKVLVQDNAGWIDAKLTDFKIKDIKYSPAK